VVWREITVIIIVMIRIIGVMIMLSSWLSSHCENLPGLIAEYQNSKQVFTNSRTTL